MNDAYSTATGPGDRFAKELRGFGPLGVVAIVVILASQTLAPLSAILVLLWVTLSRTPWAEIGYVRPRSWLVEATAGIALGVVLKFLLKIIVMPLLGADAINRTYHYIVGNPAAAISEILPLIIVGGFAEETVFRGYLFERFGKLIGKSIVAKSGTVLVTALFFASLHFYDQGFAGVEQAIFTGLVFGTVFSSTGRIWIVMCAHAAYDLTALAIIYWNLESEFAHLVFK
ncbi:MAG TPA: type II CAAX endopeptidase family protein [Candidatus Eremiobacteraceae bacterium]